MAFTGLKDTDLIILSKLDDEDLLKVCSEKNSYLNRICKDENFWRNRFIKKYGQKAGEYKSETRTWRRHYLKVLVDLQRYKDPVNFLSIIVWNEGGLDKSYFLDEDGKYKPFLTAPVWIMNNFWLLDLGEIKLGSLDSLAYVGEYTLYSHLKPYQFLEKQKTGNKYLNGLIGDRKYYIPNFVRKFGITFS